MRVLMGVIPTIITVLAFVIYAKGYKLDGAYLEEILKKVNTDKKKNSQNKNAKEPAYSVGFFALQQFL